jgi:hypothetical protein
MAEAINEEGLEWMPKSVWGPIKWKELHTRALLERSMEGEEHWLAAYLAGLPCPKCREHFEEFLRKSPPDLRSRRQFFVWTVAAHNFVNEAIGHRTLGVTEALNEHQFTPE